MTVFQNKNLVKAFLEKKIEEEKMEESLGLGKKSDDKFASCSKGVIFCK